MAPRKRKDAAADNEEATEEVKPKKKRAPKKEPRRTEPFTGEDGWTGVPPNLIYKCSGVPGNKKIAAFDMDDTLIAVKSGRNWYQDADDWKFLSPNVPEKLKEVIDGGHKIVIFHNGGNIKGALEGKGATNTKERFDKVITALAAADVPIDVFIATQQDDKQMCKPETGSWRFMVENCNDGIAVDLAESYYVGDAAGRPADPATGRKADLHAVDGHFARALGVTFKVPEDLFGTPPAPECEGSNKELQECFLKMSNFLRTKGENFKANAFRKVAKQLKDYHKEVTSGMEAKELEGVGASSAALIDEWLKSGKMQALIDMQVEAAAAALAPAEAKDPQALAFL